jgi:hypothetical protein
MRAVKDRLGHSFEELYRELGEPRSTVANTRCTLVVLE